MRSVRRLYSEDQREIGSRRSESAIGSQSWVALLAAAT
jgi:hypothetical protein